MSDNRHTLISELPEYKEKIHELKMSNHHFAKQYSEYEDLDKEIHRIEIGETPDSDQYLEDLKKKRLALKDELFHTLKNS